MTAYGTSTARGGSSLSSEIITVDAARPASSVGLSRAELKQLEAALVAEGENSITLVRKFTFMPKRNIRLGSFEALNRDRAKRMLDDEEMIIVVQPTKTISALLSEEVIARGVGGATVALVWPAPPHGALVMEQAVAAVWGSVDIKVFRTFSDIRIQHRTLGPLPWAAAGRTSSIFYAELGLQTPPMSPITPSSLCLGWVAEDLLVVQSHVSCLAAVLVGLLAQRLPL